VRGGGSQGCCMSRRVVNTAVKAAAVECHGLVTAELSCGAFASALRGCCAISWQDGCWKAAPQDPLSRLQS
jgi:hypothetical protein